MPAVLGVLREAFPACHVVCAAWGGDSAFIAASPELLVRREGLRAGTLALAGSTRRSADLAVDDHLGEQLLRSEKDREEQAIVTRRIVRALRLHSVWVTAAEEPVIAKMANIQHLATPIRAQLAHPVGAVELAGLLHPTPAVGWGAVRRRGAAHPALEGLDRGWYAGPVGWTDADEDGEFCVALPLRAAHRGGGPLLRGRGRRARLGPARGAGRDRGQARRAAAGAGGLTLRPTGGYSTPSTSTVRLGAARAASAGSPGTGRLVPLVGALDRRGTRPRRSAPAPSRPRRPRARRRDEVAPAVGLERRGRALAVGGVLLRVAHVDVQDQVGGHGPRRYRGRARYTVTTSRTVARR